jgi:single-strand DNA-binding protein
MANYNRVILIGNLTRDPQLRYTPSQMAVCDFGLATNRRWTAADGQKREEVCFVDCTAWGRSAETLAKYTTKGRQLLVEGRLTYRTWDGPDGKKRSKHEVTVQTFQFLDSRGDQAGRSREASPPAEAPPSEAPPPPGEEKQTGKSDYDFSQDLGEDTIPF